jgi:hypothetical protein
MEQNIMRISVIVLALVFATPSFAGFEDSICVKILQPIMPYCQPDIIRAPATGCTVKLPDGSLHLCLTPTHEQAIKFHQLKGD